MNKESGFEFESAPAEASNSVNVRVGQTVSLSGFSSVPSGYVVSHRRIYRSVSGTFLFVKEIAASAASFTDDVKAEDLAEELPSLTWSEPPQTLSGLTNLPNGIMAGFRGVIYISAIHTILMLGLRTIYKQLIFQSLDLVEWILRLLF